MVAGQSSKPFFGWLVTLAAAAAALVLFANMASPTVFVVDILVTLGLCGLAFRHYGRFSSNWVVTSVVLYTWFLSSAIVFVAYATDAPSSAVSPTTTAGGPAPVGTSS